MAVICDGHGQDSSGTNPENAFHGVNKEKEKTMTTKHEDETDTFITKLGIGCVEVVNKAALAWGITPPIRSESGFRRRERRKSLYSRRENVPVRGSGSLAGDL